MSASDENTWRGEVTSELRHLTQSVGAVQRQLYELQSLLAQEIAAHREYHEQNEHRWGFARWCQLHPFRLVMVLGAASALVTAGIRSGELAGLVRMFAEFLR